MEVPFQHYGEITYKGYELHQEIFLSCPSCDKKLVSIFVVKLDTPIVLEGEIMDEMIVGTKCPECNFPSFKHKISNVKVYFGGVEPYLIDDIIINNNKVEIKVINAKR